MFVTLQEVLESYFYQSIQTKQEKQAVQQILDSSQKYDEIVREWNKTKPKYDKMIKDYTQKIAVLRGQIEELIMERINDRTHAAVYIVPM